MQMRQSRIEPGALVTATDGHLGTVKEVVVQPETGALAYLVVNRGLLDGPVTVPAEAIEAIPNPMEVRLRVGREEAGTGGEVWTADAPLAAMRGDRLTIPIHEERLIPGKRPVDLGEVRIHTHVDTEQQAVSQWVTRDDVVIERTPVGRVLEAPVGPRYDEDWLIIPIMREELVITKRLVLDEELRIRKRQVNEEQVVRETVRRTRVEIEDATVHGIAGPTPAQRAAAEAATTQFDALPPADGSARTPAAGGGAR